TYSQGCSVNYVVPTFQLKATNPGCDPNSGQIDVINAADGVPPYSYTLLGPNQTNSTGVFTGLVAGTYSLELKDSCGTVRTRRVTLIPFQFSFTYSISPLSGGGCHRVQVSISTSDSSMVYQYGIHNSGSSDTTWTTSPTFVVDSVARTAAILVKDLCGNVFV